MAKADTKKALWANVSTLMTRHYGGEQLGRFARECKIGAATMTRIKCADTSVGVDVLERIAARFGIEPWQLLAEDLGANLYVINDERRVVPVVALAADTVDPRPTPPTR